MRPQQASKWFAAFTLPSSLPQVVLCQRALSSSGVTSAETLAKVLIVQSQLVRRGAKPEHVAQVMKGAVGEFSSILHT